MSRLDEQLDAACADGRMSVGDADEVRNFASFLEATTGIPRKADDRTPDQQRRFIAAYREHYPEDYARAVAEQRARRVHNHRPFDPSCNERNVGGQLRGACLNDDGSSR